MKIVKKIKKLPQFILTGQIFINLFPEMSFKVLKRRYQNKMKRLAARKEAFVLRIEYGGLGDHLVWSALPDILREQYGIAAEISLASAFRSDEIKQFVWGLNPQTKFSPEHGEALAIPKIGKYHNYNEALLGLFSADSHDLFSVAYKPILRPDLAGKIICDLTFGPSGVSNGYHEKKFWDEVSLYLKKEFRTEDLVLLEPSGYGEKGLLRHVQKTLGISSTTPVDSLRDLADCICSARERIFLDSGSKSLAAAYKKPSHVLDRGMANSYFHYSTNTHTILG
jgi:hypothetical protein